MSALFGRSSRFTFATVATAGSLLLLASGPSVMHAQTCSPTSTQVFFGVAVNGVCTDLSSLVTPTGNPGVNQTSTTLNLGGGDITINAMWDADPFITLSLTTTNATAGPTTYSFLLGTPIVPGMYTYAQSTLGVSVTAGIAGSATAGISAIYPTILSGYGGVGPVATNLGVDNGTTSCTATTASGTNTCNYSLVSNTFAPTFYDNLQALLTYTQTDALSVVSITARIDILEVSPTVVPEPSAFLLMAAGLGALGVVVRRSKR